MKPSDLENLNTQAFFTGCRIQELHIHVQGAERPLKGGITDEKDREVLDQLKGLSLEFYDLDRGEGDTWKPKNAADILDQAHRYLEARLRV